MPPQSWLNSVSFLADLKWKPFKQLLHGYLVATRVFAILYRPWYIVIIAPHDENLSNQDHDNKAARWHGHVTSLQTQQTWRKVQHIPVEKY